MDINQDELNGLLSQYGNLSEAHFFYNNTEQLRFDRKRWKWFRVCDNGSFEPLYGVTGIVHVIDKSEALMGWSKKRMGEKLRRLMVERAGAGSEDSKMQLFIGDLDQIIKEAKQADEEEKDAAGDTGHAAHDWIENFIKATLACNESRRTELLAKFPEDQRAANCCVAALEWMSRHNVRWACTERPVYSRLFKCVGTMDGLARIDSCDDTLCCKTAFKDRLSIVDWKTSNCREPYNEYRYQTGCYQKSYEEETGETVEDRWIVILGKEDADFNPWHFEGRELFEKDWLGYLHCLQLCQDIEESNAYMAGIKGHRRAVLKEIERNKKLERDKIACPKSEDYKGSRKSKCFEDGSQCAECARKYKEKHVDNAAIVE